MLCNKEYPSETHLKLKSRENSFVDIICFNCPIALLICTEKGSDTAMFYAKFQDDGMIDSDVMDQRDFARFEFKMSFARVSYILRNTPEYYLESDLDVLFDIEIAPRFYLIPNHTYVYMNSNEEQDFCSSV